jgi:hypothetical protein
VDPIIEVLLNASLKSTAGRVLSSDPNFVLVKFLRNLASFKHGRFIQILDYLIALDSSKKVDDLGTIPLSYVSLVTLGRANKVSARRSWI